MCRFPRAIILAIENSSDFVTEFQELLNSFGIKSVFAPLKNLSHNLVEILHKTLAVVISIIHFTNKKAPRSEYFAIFMCLDVTLNSAHSV